MASLKFNKNAVGITSFILIGIIFSAIYLWPFLGFRDTMFLRLDWPGEFQMTSATWITLSKYHEFPFWNPYKMGGNFLFAHPQSFVASPETLFVMLFGPIAGLYYSVLFYYILGFVGCYFLGRYFKLSFLATLYLAVIFTFQSHAMNYLFIGAHTWMTMGFIPFAIYFLLKAQHNWRYGVGAGFFHALIYLTGNTYIFMLFPIFILMFAVSNLIIKKNFNFVKGAAVMLIFTFLFASIKIIPSLDIYEGNKRVIVDSEKLPLNIEVLKKTFLDKYQAWNVISVYWIGEKNFHWPHFGDYIGILPIILALIGLVLWFKNFDLVLATFGALLLYLSAYEPFWFIWESIRLVPPFNSLQHPARFVIFLVLMLSIFGAKLISKLDKLRLKDKLWDCIKKIAIISLILFVFVDLTKSSYIITKNISPFPMQEGLIKWDEKFEIYDFYTRFNLTDEQISFFDANFIKNFNHFDTLSNKGSNKRVWDNLELAHEGKVSSKGEPGYKGEQYFVDENNSVVELKKWSPNKISLDVKTEKENILVINQYFHKHWKTKEGFELINYNGLLGIKIPEGDHKVNIYVFQNKILVGIFLFLIGIILGAYLLVNACKQGK